MNNGSPGPPKFIAEEINISNSDWFTIKTTINIFCIPVFDAYFTLEIYADKPKNGDYKYLHKLK